ncbi:MAG: hypothetical protein WCW03_01540 [Candidatus Paceibacterota bacterium]
MHLDDATDRIKKAESFVPLLLRVYATQNRPRIKFYEGTEGLKHVYEDTLTSTEPIRVYATVDDMHSALPNYFPEYYRRRAEKNISIRAIVPETPLGKERETLNKEEKREIADAMKKIYELAWAEAKRLNEDKK